MLLPIRCIAALIVPAPMRALGTFLIRGRLEAIAVVGTLTVVSWFLPPLAFVISGAPVGLITLRRGGLVGLQIIAGSLAFVVLAGMLAKLHPAVAGTFVLGIWLPVWICAVILRHAESQGALVMTAGGLGMVFAAGAYLLVEDVTDFWQSWFSDWFRSALPGEASTPYLDVLQASAPFLNAMMASALIISVVVTLLIARWWQALLYFPGAFRQEFYLLRLPRWLAGLALAAILVLLLGQGETQPLLRDLLFLSLMMYLFQGLSAAHRIVAGRKLSRAWLAGMYGLLLLVPKMLLFVACVGMVDSWLGGPPRQRGGDSG